MSRICGTRTSLLILFSTMALLIGATSASALELEIEQWSGPAFPTAGPAVANITLTYGCGDLLAAGGDIEVSADLQEGGGSASIDATSFTPATPVSDCTPGDDVTENFELSYTATIEEAEGSTASITILAVYDEDGTLEAIANETATATVGPYLDVSFAPTNTSFEAIGGDTVTVEVTVSSDSNADAQTVATLEVPPGWQAPTISAPIVASPLADGNGTSSFTFDVEVPEEADGMFTLNLTASAKTTGDIGLETDPEGIPLEFTITSLAEAEAENEDSPAPVAGLLLVAVVTLLVVVRRRS